MGRHSLTALLVAVVAATGVAPAAQAAPATCTPATIEYLGRKGAGWTFGGGLVYGITAENTSCATAKGVAVGYLKYLAGVKPKPAGYKVTKVNGKFVYRKGDAEIRFYASAEKSVRQK